jgi:hypothetical protein
VRTQSETYATGEAWLSATVTHRTIAADGESVSLTFEDERGEVCCPDTVLMPDEEGRDDNDGTQDRQR